MTRRPIALAVAVGATMALLPGVSLASAQSAPTLSGDAARQTVDSCSSAAEQVRCYRTAVRTLTLDVQRAANQQATAPLKEFSEVIRARDDALEAVMARTATDVGPATVLEGITGIAVEEDPQSPDTLKRSQQSVAVCNAAVGMTSQNNIPVFNHNMSCTTIVQQIDYSSKLWRKNSAGAWYIAERADGHVSSTNGFTKLVRTGNLHGWMCGVGDTAVTPRPGWALGTSPYTTKKTSRVRYANGVIVEVASLAC